MPTTPTAIPPTPSAISWADEIDWKFRLEAMMDDTVGTGCATGSTPVGDKEFSALDAIVRCGRVRKGIVDDLCLWMPGKKE